MNYRANDPGAVQYGNFINYYSFNSATDRVNMLPNEILSPILSRGGKDVHENDVLLVLDVGCNSGDFTQLLYDYLSKLTGRTIYILGVDIDSALIDRACQNNVHSENVSYRSVDVMTGDEFDKIKDEFFAQFSHRTKFDATFCLSITMWIHLNHRDEGLQEFLRKLSEISQLLVIEPQPWKCYLTAVKRLKKANESFPNFPSLKWRNSVETEIQNCMETSLEMRMIYETTPTKWNRKICFYTRNKD